MSQQPQHLSPDGNYRWDGRQWQPVAQPALAPSSGYAIQPAVYGPQAGGVMVYQPPTNGMAVTSLVFGIISWFLCPFVGGVVAIICGHTARGQIRRTHEGGSGLATAGLILGYLHIIAWAVVLFFWIVLFGGLAILAAVGGAIPTPSP